MQILLEILSVHFDVLTVCYTIVSAVRSFVLPHRENVPLTRWIFNIMGFFFSVRRSTARTYEERDRVMALFAPLTLLIVQGFCKVDERVAKG